MSVATRQLCDRRVLLKKYATAVAKGQTPINVARALLQNTYRKAMQTLEKRFWQDKDGLAVLRGRSGVVDQLLRSSIDMLFPDDKPPLTLAATGGYGRQELAPHSDIDILVLLPDSGDADALEQLLALWWDMPWTLSHTTRQKNDFSRVAAMDVATQTALLDARFLYGDQAGFASVWWDFYQALQAEKPAFLKAKTEELLARHRQVRYAYGAVQPDLKEGQGGLRDAHTLWWWAKATAPLSSLDTLAEEGWLALSQQAFWRDALATVQTYRVAVHFLKEKPDNILDFQTQTMLANRFGITADGNKAVDALMTELRPALRVLATVAEAAIPNTGAAPDLPALDSAFTTPADWFHLFAEACASGAPVSAAALTRIEQQLAQHAPDTACYQAFLGILCHARNPEATLHTMSRIGLIGWLLPDYARIVGKMQYDQYHVYTVDYHTLRGVGLMHQVAEGVLDATLPLSTRLMGVVAAPKILYMAIFLHDIAKGRGGDHSVLGAEVAHTVCPLFGFDEDETALVAWLVAQHLTMSFYAFKRDSHDPDTIVQFAEIVRTVERLRYLLILTAVDMRATNPGLLTSWKASLLRDLYEATENLLTGGLLAFGKEGALRDSRQRLTDWATAHLPAVLPLLPALPDAYWLSVPFAQQPDHMARLLQHRPPVHITHRRLEDKEVTELTITGADTPGLFARLARRLTLQHVNIIDARLYTLHNGLVFDMLQIQSHGAPLWPDHAQRLCHRLTEALTTPMPAPAPATVRSGRRLSVAVDTSSSADNTIIEVTGDDRPGLLADLAEHLHAHGLSISRARITTFANRAVDVFYVTTLNGQKIQDKALLATLQQGLEALG